MTNVDDLLDQRETGGGDYPDWWEPENEGETLQGIVTDRRDDPWAPDGEEDPKQMLHIKDEDGTEWSTRLHTILSNLIKDQDIRVDDYVRVTYQGKTSTKGGTMANDYTVAVVRADELEDVDVPSADGGIRLQRAEEFIEAILEFHGEVRLESLDRFTGGDGEKTAHALGYTIQDGYIR